MKKARKRNAPASAAPTVPAEAPPVAAPSKPSPWRRHLMVLGGLWIVALLAYSNSFPAGLTFDNGVVVQQDPRIRAVTSQNLQQIFSEEYWYPSMSNGLYRPLATLSYLFNYAVLGNQANPAGYHWVNFALHAANIALVYFLGLLLLEEMSWAGLLAALWALHPLLTESVTNIVGRADELAALGVFAGLLCHIRAGQATGRGKLAWLAGLTLSAAVAVFSKESGVVLAAVMLCYDVTFGRSKPWGPRLAAYASVAAPFAIFFWLRARMLDHLSIPVLPFVDNPLVNAPFAAGALTAFKVIGMYLWLFLWPARLSCNYSYNQIRLFRGSFDWNDIAALLSFGLCLAAGFLAIRAWRRGRNLWCFAIVFFFVTLAPTANLLLPVGAIMAERWLYLPSLGLALAVVMGLQALGRRLPAVPARSLFAAAGVVCLAWSARTYVRNFDWRDEQTLWESAASSTPDSFMAYSILANVLINSPEKPVDRAIQEAERSTAILNPLPDDENIPRPFAVAGMCYRVKGAGLSDPAGRQVWYRKSLDALLRARRIDLAARAQLNRVNQAHGKGEYQTGLALLYLELGRIQRLLGQNREALESLAYGRLLSPMADFSEEESQVYQDLGQPDHAAVALFEGWVIDPHSQRLVRKIVQLYKQTAPLTCAVRSSGDASTLDPQCPLVHGHICEAAQNVVAAYRGSGKMDRAMATMQTAVSGLGCPASQFQ